MYYKEMLDKEETHTDKALPTDIMPQKTKKNYQ